MRVKVLFFYLVAVCCCLSVLSPASAVAAENIGYNVTSELWAKAVLQTPSGPIYLIWREVGADTTPSGASVVSGYFYACPDDFAYGSEYNPEVFVKIYIDPSGWANIAFNHVTVDPVDISSAHNYSGSANQSGTITTSSRLAEHQYDGVGTSSATPTNYDGTYRGSASSTNSTDHYGDPCGTATITMIVNNNSISGTIRTWDGYTVSMTGTVNSDGSLSNCVGKYQGETVGWVEGSINGTSGSGTFTDVWGCYGTWSLSK